jgi:hypothetical protein
VEIRLSSPVATIGIGLEKMDSQTGRDSLEVLSFH